MVNVAPIRTVFRPCPLNDVTLDVFIVKLVMTIVLLDVPFWIVMDEGRVITTVAFESPLIRILPRLEVPPKSTNGPEIIGVFELDGITTVPDADSPAA